LFFLVFLNKVIYTIIINQKKTLTSHFFSRGCPIITDNLEKNLHEARRSPRVKENSRISWFFKDESSKGEARIHNISASGMLMEADSSFIPKDDAVFNFQANNGKIDFLPDVGRLVWYRQKPFAKDRYLCGVEFINPSESILSRLQDRVRSGVEKLNSLRKTRSILNVCLIIAMIGIIGYTVWLGAKVYNQISATTNKMLAVSDKQSSLTRGYVKVYKETKAELETTKVELETTKDLLFDARFDLEETKDALQETQTLLDQVTAEKIRLGEDVNKMKALNDKYSLAMADLEQKNVQINAEMKILQDQLSYYAGNVKSVDEGKELMDVFRQRMKLVKGKIKAFKEEAVKARAAALKERDRLKSMLGNKGYFMKEGNIVKVDMDEYNALGAKEIKSDVNKGRKVNINVNFFKK
jgi:DNA repair exonuclease SbcCD ATPase subunit